MNDGTIKLENKNSNHEKTKAFNKTSTAVIKILYNLTKKNHKQKLTQ